MFGVLLNKEHVLEIESLIIRSLYEIDNELSSKTLNMKVKNEMVQKKKILCELYDRLPL